MKTDVEERSVYPEDREIIDQIISGNVNAFEHLLKKYQNYVVGIVKRHIPYDEVKDTTQDVFLRAFQSLRTFSGRGGFQKWLSTIALRTCCDFWRKRYKFQPVSMSSLSEDHRAWLEEALSEQSTQSYQEKGAQKEAREILDWALEKLSAEDRMVLELVYLEGHSVKETAALLGWSIANVKVRSFRSRRKLLKLFQTNNRRSGT